MNLRTDMIVDSVDDANRPLAKVPRKELLPAHLNFRTVHVFLFDSAGSLILQKLASNHPRSPNKLGSSVAGYLYAGETYLAAARRRMAAELNVRAELRSLGTVEVGDGDSKKFVRLYQGILRQPPHIGDWTIQALLKLTPTEIRRLVELSPNKFTKTFLPLYRHYEKETKSARRRRAK
jgi:isopentenyldiphosphate isomerase